MIRRDSDERTEQAGWQLGSRMGSPTTSTNRNGDGDSPDDVRTLRA